MDYFHEHRFLEDIRLSSCAHRRAAQISILRQGKASSRELEIGSAIAKAVPKWLSLAAAAGRASSLPGRMRSFVQKITFQCRTMVRSSRREPSLPKPLDRLSTKNPARSVTRKLISHPPPSMYDRNLAENRLQALIRVQPFWKRNKAGTAADGVNWEPAKCLSSFGTGEARCPFNS